jgi:hypothetical protein
MVVIQMLVIKVVVKLVVKMVPDPHPKMRLQRKCTRLHPEHITTMTSTKGSPCGNPDSSVFWS